MQSFFFYLSQFLKLVLSIEIIIEHVFANTSIPILIYKYHEHDTSLCDILVKKLTTICNINLMQGTMVSLKKIKSGFTLKSYYIQTLLTL